MGEAWLKSSQNVVIIHNIEGFNSLSAPSDECATATTFKGFAVGFPVGWDVSAVYRILY